MADLPHLWPLIGWALKQVGWDSVGRSGMVGGFLIKMSVGWGGKGVICSAMRFYPFPISENGYG